MTRFETFIVETAVLVCEAGAIGLFIFAVLVWAAVAAGA